MKRFTFRIIVESRLRFVIERDCIDREQARDEAALLGRQVEPCAYSDSGKALSYVVEALCEEGRRCALVAVRP